MNTYTELLNDLRYCLSGYTKCVDCKRYGQMCCESFLMEKAADAIENMVCDFADEHNARLDAEDKLRWRRVENGEIPKAGQQVLVRVLAFGIPMLRLGLYASNLEDADDVDFAGEHRPGFYWISSEYGCVEMCDVTGWMPAPCVEDI